MKFRVFLLLLLSAVPLLAAPPREFKVGDNLWRCYSKGKVLRTAANEFRIIDADEKNGAGLTCTLPASTGERLQFSGKFKALNNDVEKLFLQIRFMPQKKIVQQQFSLFYGEDFHNIEVNLPTPPTGSKQVIVYIYVQPGKSEFLLRDLKLAPLKEEKFDASKLKARRKTMTLNAQTVALLPADGSADAAFEEFRKNSPIQFRVTKNVPAKGSYQSCILVGNRNNNQLISDLYDRHHLIADSYYPGKGGHQVRTIFDPENNGVDYLLVSGSGNGETATAIRRLQTALQKISAANGAMQVPFFWDVKLSPEHKLSSVVGKTHTFDESEGYGMRFFGWNILARYMALFYSTGEEKYARRFLELAFRKNAGAIAELGTDAGTFKLVNDPLAGPYHYSSVMANLYWEMIADHPVFSDKERTGVIAAMYRQFLFWRDTSNGCGVYNNFTPAVMVGNRHGEWAAISLYTAARYLNKVMPSAEYIHAQKAAENFFDSIKKYYYVEGEGGNLTWFPSGREPVALFVLLAGWKEAAKDGGLADMYHALETLCGNRHGKRIRYYVPLGLLRRMAYLLNDNAPLALEKRLSEHFNAQTFRLGQSFAPARPYGKNTPTPLQKWNFIKPSKAEIPSWRMPFKDTQNGFFITSWRQDEENGDLIIIDGHLDKISRQPLHAMTIFTLAMDNLQLLAGYRNQLWARHDGLSFSSMPNTAHFEGAMSLPDTAGFASSLDISATLNWQRSLLKLNGYTVIADTLKEKGSAPKQYSIDAMWEAAPGLERKLLDNGQIELVSTDLQANSRFYVGALTSSYTIEPANGDLVRLAGGVPSLLFKAKTPGEKLSVDFTLKEAFAGKAVLRMYAFKDRGRFNVYLDGNLLQSDLDHYSDAARAVNLELGEMNLAAGKHTLVLESAGTSGGETMSVAFSALSLQDINAEPRKGSITFSHPATVRLENHKGVVNDLLSGNVMRYTFQAELMPRQARTFFTLAASKGAEKLSAETISSNAALLRTPDLTLAVQGAYKAQNIQSQLAVLSSKMLCGMQLTQAGTLFTAPAPVDVKWDLVSGKLQIYTHKPVQIKAAGRSFKLQAGLNTLNCPVPAAMQKKLAAALKSLQQQKSAVSTAQTKLHAPAKNSISQYKADNFVSQMLIFNNLLAVTDGNEVKILNRDLKLVKTLTADAQVGKLAYAADSKLLLAGCGDGKVIAFDPASGKRCWEHLSREADGLLETGASWYLKSAFPGIYGLAAGRFAQNKENIFVGSASTMEVLNSQGKLLRRFKILWGPVQHFELFQQPAGNVLLLSQLYPGSDYLTRVDDKFNTRIGYNLPPVGCLYFANWMGINRTGITAVDLDKDGAVKIVSGLNGVWNRIIVWDAAGKPLREVSFGIGDSLKVPPYGRERAVPRTLYDVAVIENAQRNYIAAAASEALILFDNKLKKVWSRLLPSEPVITVAGKGYIISGLRSGELCFYNMQGVLKNIFSNPHPWTAMEINNDTLFAADAEGNVYKFKL